MPQTYFARITAISAADPKSLPESWKNFFDGLSDDEKLVFNDLRGPTWSPEKKFKKLEPN